MLTKQHPRPDEIQAYVSNDLQPPASVRLAQHLLACPECMGKAADVEERLDRGHRWLNELHRPAPPLARLGASVRQAWSAPSSGLATGLATVLLMSMGIGSVVRQQAPAETVVAFAADVEHGLPEEDLRLASAEAAGIEPSTTIRQASVRSRHRKAPRRALRRFVAPDGGNSVYEVGYLLPPPPRVSLAGGTARLQLASLSTDVGPMPDEPVKASKRHPLRRFFAAIAKPFRSDGT